VADALRTEGITVTDREIYGASKMAPVDCNDSEAGRRQNRRVEVWLEE
jgi:outer membrane protein OmpA-like peptidoglycan-associated protein